MEQDHRLTTISLRVTREQHEHLKELAWRRRTSISEMVRDSVQPLLDAPLPPAPTPWPGGQEVTVHEPAGEEV